MSGLLGVNTLRELYPIGSQILTTEHNSPGKVMTHITKPGSLRNPGLVVVEWLNSKGGVKMLDSSKIIGKNSSKNNRGNFNSKMAIHQGGRRQTYRRRRRRCRQTYRRHRN